jgi:hypothetical protein
MRHHMDTSKNSRISEDTSHQHRSELRAKTEGSYTQTEKKVSSELSEQRRLDRAECYQGANNSWPISKEQHYWCAVPAGASPQFTANSTHKANSSAALDQLEFMYGSRGIGNCPLGSMRTPPPYTTHLGGRPLTRARRASTPG